MYFKLIDREAVSSFSPKNKLLATGTRYNQASFTQGSQLEIFPIDFKNEGVQLETPYQPLSVPDMFTNLSWGICPKNQYGDTEFGVIAGSLANGSVCLFNPMQILNSNLEEAHFDTIIHHKGIVTTLNFNNHPQYSSHLACGTSTGEFTIWDINNPRAPIIDAPASTKDKLASTAVSCVQWNSGVGPIVACGQEGGWISVWDIRAQSKKFQIKDSAMGRPSAICWNPLNPTQFVVAFDEDRFPMLKLWDLRYLQKSAGHGSSEYSPNKEFIGHKQGILSAQWNHDDPSLLISTGKDGLTICWDMSSQVEYFSQMQDPHNFSTSVEWAPSTAGLFSSTSNDGKIYLYNILAANYQLQQDSQEPVPMPLQRPPKWMSKQSGATFGFGDKLLQLQEQSYQNQKSTVVQIEQVDANKQLVDLSNEFYTALVSGDTDYLRSYCEAKSRLYNEKGKPEEGEVWRYLQLLYSHSFKESLLQELGFGDVLQAQESQTEIGLQHEKSQMTQMMDQVQNAQEALNNAADLSAQDGNNGQDFFNQPFSPVPNIDQSSFFDQVVTPQSMQDPYLSNNVFSSNQKTNSNVMKQISNDFSGMNLQNEDPLLKSNYSISSEETQTDNEIQRALFVGNYEVACQKCLKANRTTDALAIAKFSNSDAMYNKILGDYLEAHGRPYMKILQNFTTGDLEGLIKNRPLMHWKDTLALLVTYGGEQFSSLSILLGSRLQAAGQRHSATLCYLCGGDVDKLASVILDKAKLNSGDTQTFEDSFEKTILAVSKYNLYCSNTQFIKLLSLYSQLLTSSGRQDLALEWLNYASVQDNLVAENLKDRIYQSDIQGVVSQYPKPPVPFEVEDLQVSMGGSSYPQQKTFGQGLQQNSAKNLQVNTRPAQQNPNSGYQYQAPAQSQQQQYYQPQFPTQVQQGYQQPTTPTFATQTTPKQFSKPQPFNAPQQFTTSPQQYNNPTQQYAQQPNQFVPPPQPNAFPEPKANKAFQPPQKVGPPNLNKPSNHSGSAVPTPKGPQSNSQLSSMNPQQSAFINNPQQQYQPPMQQEPDLLQLSQQYGQQQQPKVFKPTQPVAQSPGPIPSQPVVNQGPSPVMAQQQGGAPFGGPPPQRYNPTAQPFNAVEQNGSAHSDHSQQTQRSTVHEPPSNVTLSNAETTQVASNLIRVVQTLRNVFENLRTVNTDPIKKKQLELLDKKIGILVWKINQNEISDELAQNLSLICQALDAQDHSQAMQGYQQMQLHQRDEIKNWNVALKKLLQLASQTN